MSKFIRTTSITSLVFGSAALALISVSPVTPAAAQGVPAGLTRLDSAQGYDAQASAELQQPKVRNTYAHVRKNKDQAQ
jgi:hypothetical protein